MHVFKRNDTRSSTNSPALGQSSSITQKHYVTLTSPEKVGDVDSKRINKLNDLFDDSSLFETSTNVCSAETPTFVSSFEKSAQGLTEELPLGGVSGGFSKITRTFEKVSPTVNFYFEDVPSQLSLASEKQTGGVEIQELSTAKMSNGTTIEPTEITTVEYYVTDAFPTTSTNVAEDLENIENLLKKQHVSTEYRSHKRIANITSKSAADVI